MLPGEVGLFALRALKKGTIINKSSCCDEKLFSKNLYEKLDKITKGVVTAFCTKVYDGFFGVPDMNYMPYHGLEITAASRILDLIEK